MEQAYTISEAAGLLGVTYQRVSQIIRAGHIKTFRVGVAKRYVRIKRSEVEKYALLAGKRLKEEG